MLTLPVDTVRIVEVARFLDESMSRALCSFHMRSGPGRSQRHALLHQQPVISSGCLITASPPLAVSLRKLRGCSLQLIVLAQILTQIKKPK